MAEPAAIPAALAEGLTDRHPYLWLDALTQLVRVEGRVVRVSVVVATAVNTGGKREVLGIDVGTSEDVGELPEDGRSVCTLSRSTFCSAANAVYSALRRVSGLSRFDPRGLGR